MAKTCVECKFLYFSTGSPGCSEMTPSSEASLYCLKGYWDIEAYEDGTHDFRQKMRTAETCKDFTEEVQ